MTGSQNGTKITIYVKIKITTYVTTNLANTIDDGSYKMSESVTLCATH